MVPNRIEVTTVLTPGLQE